MPGATPDRSLIWSSTFVSYRRLWLDSLLDGFAAEMRGQVIDLGGKALKKRGTFRPPEDQCDSWWYVNLEMETRPDFLADISCLPVQSRVVDVVICTEVLEHLERPAACVDEILRVLRTGGIGFVSVPFLYPVHADPFDMQRFTADGLRSLFHGFSSVEILEMGGYLGTMGMFIELGGSSIEGRGLRHKIARRAARLAARALCWIDLATQGQASGPQRFTTGYFVRIVK